MKMNYVRPRDTVKVLQEVIDAIVLYDFMIDLDDIYNIYKHPYQYVGTTRKLAYEYVMGVDKAITAAMEEDLDVDIRMTLLKAQTYFLMFERTLTSFELRLDFLRGAGDEQYDDEFYNLLDEFQSVRNLTINTVKLLQKTIRFIQHMHEEEFKHDAS